MMRAHCKNPISLAIMSKGNIFCGMEGMKKKHWSRLLLWSHVVSMIGFYLFLWFRTRPGSENREVRRKVKSPLHSATGEAETPVSIIVPVRNEERNIVRCVTS